MKINNRRYIGCKTKLLSFIEQTVLEFSKEGYKTFADIFAGTGVVGFNFSRIGFETILNDTLYSNYVCYKAFLGNEKIRTDILREFLNRVNCIDSERLEDNYFSKVYGDKYFSVQDAKKIGYIREEIENHKSFFNEREYCYLLTSLIYTTDKIANTVGHFESFLKKKAITKNVILNELEIIEMSSKSIAYNQDANELVKHICCDIAYIDPPYNARQYVNFYHVLENLARWNKPEVFEGNSMKFKRNELKSDYCRKTAPLLFKELINNLNAKLIIVSYNNTYKAGSVSSINTIKESEIYEILSKKGTVTKKEIDYNAFNSGKTEIKNHKEYLFICEVQ